MSTHVNFPAVLAATVAGMGGGLAGVFISAYMLARFIGWLNAGTLLGGIKIAFHAWLGFMLQVILGFSIFGGKDKRAMRNTTLIQSGHYLAGLLIMGAILGAWR